MVKVNIKENSWLAAIAANRLKTKRVALVLGHTIHLHGATTQELLTNKPWLLHELKHVQQYHRLGTIPFLWQYLLESIRHGYLNNRFEIEAREAEHEETLLLQHDISRYLI
jgi:hypothetical protein